MRPLILSVAIAWLVAAALAQSPQARAAEDFGVVAATKTPWISDEGAVMVVNNYNRKTGAFRGSFTNKATGTCARNRPQRLSGYFNRNAISFTVHAKACRVIKTWTGKRTGPKTIEAYWTAVLADGSKPRPLEDSARTGTDTFVMK